jgi:hypothetical protein
MVAPTAAAVLPTKLEALDPNGQPLGNTISPTATLPWLNL